MTSDQAFRSAQLVMDGVRWHHREAGPADARPVVVLHGLGAAGEAQLPVARRLAAHHRVLVPDLPGFGRSSDPPGVPDVVALADALHTWLGAVVGTPVILVANSLGCQVGAHVAARAPASVSALVLQGPTMDHRARSATRQAVRLALTGRAERPSLALVQLRGLRRMGVRRYAGTLRAALRDHVEETVARTHCPVLVVRGGRDRVVPQRWAETVAARAPQGQLRVVPGQGHCMVYSAPRELARVVSAWVERVVAP